MKTLIELYDERPIKNVLATDMFHPEETIILCPPNVTDIRKVRTTIEKYLDYRRCNTRITVIQVSLLDARKTEKRLRNILESHPDCAINISGGSDTTLYAVGRSCGETPVFTFSRKNNTFYDVSNAAFARNLPCTSIHDAQACFLLAGGKMLPGRADNSDLKDRLSQIDSLFSVFRKNRRIWRSQITYIQKISSSLPGELSAKGKPAVQADHGMVAADNSFLTALQDADLIRDLKISDEEIRFTFPDETIRFWLRDIGSVLELQVWRACLEAGCFDDVVLSAVVNWEGADTQRNTVTNEIDVVAVRGVWPTFISCKTSEIHTEALNELAVLNYKFGRNGNKAVIVTSAPSTKGRSVMRQRAAEMNIEVIEWDDLELDRLTQRIRSITEQK